MRYLITSLLAIVLLSSPVFAEEKQITVTLTEEEARVLINLLDVAVRAEGLNAAEAALHFVNKIQKTTNTGDTK